MVTANIRVYCDVGSATTAFMVILAQVIADIVCHDPGGVSVALLILFLAGCWCGVGIGVHHLG